MQPEVKTPEQRELLRSLERGFQQAARGETRPAKDLCRSGKLSWLTESPLTISLRT